MTQNSPDVEIANQGFAAFRQDLNDVLEDITTLHSGTAAPSTTYANQWWYETDTDKLYIRNEDNDAWIEILTLDQANDHLASLGASITLDGTGNVSIDSGDFTVDTNTLHVDSTNNRVGIGVGVPDHPLRVSGNGFGTIAKFSADDGSNNPRLLIYGSSDGMHIQRTSSSGASNLMFEVGGAEGGGTEAMRVDGSGNVLVAKTAANTSTVGVEARGDGLIVGTRNGGQPLLLDRLTSDGDLIIFRKDSATVGSIGAYTGLVYFGQGDTNLMATDSGNQLLPRGTNGANRDNAIDLGSPSNRFDDIYATNTTIQPSDQNEKQQIASLTDAEITAAKAISKLFKTFKWNDSVAENGDNARTHTGVIAQDVQQALTDADLDAGDYAFFISNTWRETQTEVPAVEAVEAQDAVYDEDGNIVTEAVEAVEAQEAYTRTDTYETAEEAPEGATERTRLGIRYPELLAFVGAATEQRLVNIETRLTALEN